MDTQTDRSATDDFPIASQGTAQPETFVTREAARFVADLTFDQLPADAISIARRCIVDTVGLYAAGLTEESVRIVSAMADEEGGREDAILLGGGSRRVPARAAARVLGIAAHAHDFDDTQISHDPKHVYGLLTHPTTAPLSAALAIADMRKEVSGEAFATAFLAGFEVSCKLSEWLLPDHYLRGHHSSGTVATFGAAMAAGKLLNLDSERLQNAIGIAASMAAGVRCSFGTMCKPWHVGRAAENGVVAAMMAERGFEGDPNALDGRWGFASILASGWSIEKLSQGYGETWSIIDPGVSIKPYPSGILTHQAMDMVLDLVDQEDIDPSHVKRIDFYAGDNILNPIRYPVAQNALQAKFSMAALIAMLVLFRQAGLAQFRDEIVSTSAFQHLQKRITCRRDPAIDALGYDLIRSRVEITMRDQRVFSAKSDDRYRGGPMLPMTDQELEAKFRACCNSVPVDPETIDALFHASAKSFETQGPNQLLDTMRRLRRVD